MIADVCTRWWATHAMVERLVKLRKALRMLEVQDELGECDPLTLDDWNKLMHFLAILKPFKDAQTFLEGQNYVTASAVAHMIHKIRIALKEAAESDTNSAREAAKALRKDFIDRWRDDDEAVFEQLRALGYIE